MARRKVGKKKKNRNKKTFGKALDAELREALGGHRARAAQKPDHELFFVSTSKSMAPTTRRAVVRKLYAAKRAAKLARPLTSLPLIAPHDQPKVAKLATAMSIGACPADPDRQIEDFGIVKAAVVVKAKEPVQKVYDAWAVEEDKKEDREGNEWFREMDGRNRPRLGLGLGLGLGLKRKRSEGRKRGCAAVQVCHPGGSYNPSLDQHQAGLAALVEKELEHRQKKSSHVKPLLDAAEKRLKQADDEEEEKEEEEEEEEKEEEQESELIREKKRAKLTKTERNKQARTREEASRLKERRLRKKFEADLSNAAAIHKEVKREERQKKARLNQRKRRMKEKEKEMESRPVVKVNGKVVVRAPTVDVVLPSQLSDNLRRMKPHGGLLSDRFASMQGRNLLETGNMMRQRHKRRGRKKVILRGKDFIEKPKGNTPKGTKPVHRLSNRYN